jgi:hypothetical protein
MDRLRLKQCLEAAGVPEDRYLLVGLDPPRAVRGGACIVRPNQRSWEVLIWEPAKLVASLSFVNEGQACDYALDVLTAAAGYRGVPVLDGTAEAITGGELTPAPSATGAGLASLAGSTKTPLQL